MDSAPPVLVAIAGPNGTGKSIFYSSQLSLANRVFVNSGVLAAELGLGVYEAAELAENLGQTLLAAKESFVFETVFSDPKGAKLAPWGKAVGLSSAETSQERVAMLVSQGGHDIPDDKLEAGFPRTLENLQKAIRAFRKFASTTTVICGGPTAWPQLSTRENWFSGISPLQIGPQARWRRQELQFRLGLKILVDKVLNLV